MNANGMKLFVGCVENRNDPLQLGRCQVRIIGLHTEDKTKLPTDDLPWAYPVQPITSAGVSGVGASPIGPVEGSWLLLSFLDPDLQQPLMVGSLGGSFQTASALASGQIVHNVVDPDGKIVDSVSIQSSGITNDTTDTSTSTTTTTTNGTTQADAEETPAIVKPGAVVTDKNEIIGPLGKLVAKAESGAEGYNAFNRGTSNGTIIGAGSTKLNLVGMTLNEIMAKQALPPGAPDKLFAVGKYQCIPITLREACTALNIDPNTSFNETVQDRICQEYLVGKKRPPLIAYYNNPDKNNETLLRKAGTSLAAEFASIEDPAYPGYPYGGPEGKYYKSGNKVGTRWAVIKSTLLQEWDFRNGKKSSVASTSNVSSTEITTSSVNTTVATPEPTKNIPPAIAQTRDKQSKGTDYFGVAKLEPEDDSTKSTPKETSSTTTAAPAVSTLGAFNLTSFTSSIPGLSSLGGISALSDLGLDTSMLEGLGADVVGSIVEQAVAFKELVADIDIAGPISQLTEGAGSLLSDFGSSLSEIASNLGIDNVTGSLTELTNELGLSFPTPQAIVSELEKLANSPQGKAKSLLAKLEEQGEPSVKKVAAIGTRNADGTISNGNSVDPLKGFQDPSGQYPKYRSEPDTNRLATGNNLGRTYVLKKEASLKTNIPIANGGTWSQSPVPYNAVYPYNKVTQSEAGHVMEFDDTPGSERVHFWHKAGSFLEWDANGTQVNRIVGDGFTIYERNGNIYVKGACNVSVDGALNVRTDNIMNLEVSGAMKVNIYNNAEINVSGNCNLAVGSELNAKAAKVNLESTGQFNIKAGTGLNIQSGSDTNIKVGGDFKVSADADVSHYAEGSVYLESAININAKSAEAVNIQGGTEINVKGAENVNVQSDADINIKAEGLANVSSEGDINIKSGSSVNTESSSELNLKAGTVGRFSTSGKLSVRAGGVLAMDGSIIDIQNNSSDQAGSADDAGEAEESAEALAVRAAGQTDLELPIETRGTSGASSLPPLSVATRSTETPLEDGSPGGSVAAVQSRQLANNSTTVSDISDPKAASDAAAPEGKSGAARAGDVSSILAMDTSQFTAGLRLSDNWTLGELTMGGVRIPRTSYQVLLSNRSTTTVTVTPQEIVANLKELCINVLEPLTTKYGKNAFKITSGFRRPPVGNRMGDLGQPDWGDHVVGAAVDIQFESKAKNFQVAKELTTLFPSWNQIILEYLNSGSWIHISYRSPAVKSSVTNQGHAFTMNAASGSIISKGVNGGFVLV